MSNNADSLDQKQRGSSTNSSRVRAAGCSSLTVNRKPLIGKENSISLQAKEKLLGTIRIKEPADLRIHLRTV